MTSDGGETWEWLPLTANSTADNIRPIMPKSKDEAAVLWLRGTCTDYKRHDLDVVGVLTNRCTRSGP